MPNEHSTITLNDVAHRAGVSPMTVSNVINGKSNVRPATRQRVLDAIAQIGYRVNPVARSLAGGHNRMISVLTPQLNRPYAAEVVQGAAEAAERLNYDLVVMMLSPESTSDFSMMVRLSIGALLIQPSRQTPWFSADLPPHIVSVDGPSAYPLMVDNYGGACLAMQHLLTLGHTRIGFISGLEAEPDLHGTSDGDHPNERNDAHERFRGYYESLALAGLPMLPDYVQHGNFTKGSGEQAARNLMRLPVPPTALFVSGDAMALGALHAVQDLGLNIPEELSIVGFDDLPMATASRPGLTTVRQPLLHMGAVAIQILAALSSGKEVPAPTPFSTELIIRDSTARR